MKFEQLGFGLGLRTEHYQDILQSSPNVDWFEALTENYMVDGGTPLHYLDQICARYPIVLHGVSLSIGGTDPLSIDYLLKLKALIERTNARWVSDHLCWTGVDGTNTHDLLPIPYTKEALDNVCARIDCVQEYLQMPLVLENPSTYLQFKEQEMSEADFISAMCQRSGCKLLLDVNNVYVNAHNHGFNALAFIKALPAESIVQIHLAGHTRDGAIIVDSHDQPVLSDVLKLYVNTITHIGHPVSTMIERDANIPPLSECVHELDLVRQTVSQQVASEEVACA